MVHNPNLQFGELAEGAVSDIRLINHYYVTSRVTSNSITTTGRFAGSEVRFGDRATQFAVANVVGVVEHYAEQVLLEAGCEPKKVKTWVDKPAAWKNKFGVNIEDTEVCPSFAQMRGYYEARNAIMHRRGELTHSQRTSGSFARLRAARIERIGFDLVITQETVRDCVEVCVSCVTELDRTTRPTTSR